MANQFTVSGKEKAKWRPPAKEQEGVVLTARQRRFFLNLATDRFKSLRQAAIDAGYAMTSASTICVTMAKDYREYIEGLRLDLWEDSTKEEAKRRGNIAKKVLMDLALHSENDNVRRLASRDLLELAGELRDKPERQDDLTPKDLRLEAQRAAQSIASQTTTSETALSVSKPVSNAVN